MSSIQCETPVRRIGDVLLLSLAPELSRSLTSRGMIYVNAEINALPYSAPLEPDGRGSHWLKLSAEFASAAGFGVGDVVTLRLEESPLWPDPPLPADFSAALREDPPLVSTWQTLTPRAKWEWLRWIRATTSPQTRQKRIKVAMDKLRGGARRPCCFNSAMCTDTRVSKSGILLEALLP